MKKIKRRPCPFYGWDVIDGVVDSKKGYRIQCRNCKGGTGWFKYWADAVTAWNRRAGEDDERSD